MNMRLRSQVAAEAKTRANIRWRVQSGFYTADDIIEGIAESLAHNEDITQLEANKKVRRIVAEEWAAQLEKQQTWPPGPTVSDKVAMAFDSLRRNHKILAGMNQPCCNSCGIGELQEDWDDDIRGYVCFREQTTEAVVHGGALYLAFGAFSKSDRRNREVGGVIVRSLRRAGLRVEWQLDPKVKILVRCGEWRRRLDDEEELEDVFDDDFDGDCKSLPSEDEEDEEDEADEGGMKEELELLLSDEYATL